MVFLTRREARLVNRQMMGRANHAQFRRSVTRGDCARAPGIYQGSITLG